jgi:RNA polymerase sigma factor (TIGR02999 family)
VGGSHGGVRQLDAPAVRLAPVARPREGPRSFTGGPQAPPVFCYTDFRDAARDLLPLLYDELKALARARMAHLAPGQTLQATALVHEAYLKLVGGADPGWDSRGHFFGAASRAMRQILVDQARRKGARKHGGDLQRLDVEGAEIALEGPAEDVVALHEALETLEAEDPKKAQIVMLRQFAGLKRDEIASALGVSVRTVDREWHYSIARLHQLMSGEGGEDEAD